VTITRDDVPESLSVDGFDAFMYRFEPSGLAFSSPATLTITLPSQEGSAIVVGVLGLGSVDGALEHLPAIFTNDGDTLTIEAEVTHFTDLVGWIGGHDLAVPVVSDCAAPVVLEAETCSISVLPIAAYPEPTTASVAIVSSPALTAEPAKLTALNGGTLVDLTCDRTEVEVAAYQFDVNLGGFTIDQLSFTVGPLPLLQLADPPAGDAYRYRINTTCVAVDGSTTTTSGASGGGTALEGGVSTTATDPTGDFMDPTVLTEERGFANVEADPPAGLDITGATVEYAPDGDTIITTINFSDRYVETRVLIDWNGDFFEADYHNGTIYTSGGPDGLDCSFEWLSDGSIRITVKGHTPKTGDRVRIRVFSQLGTGADKQVQGDELDMTLSPAPGGATASAPPRRARPRSPWR